MPNGLNKKQVQVRFNPALLKTMDKVAKMQGMNRTEFIERAIRREIMRVLKKSEVRTATQ